MGIYSRSCITVRWAYRMQHPVKRNERNVFFLCARIATPRVTRLEAFVISRRRTLHVQPTTQV